MHSEKVIMEIERCINASISEDQVCVVIDAGILFPYDNPEIIIFDVCLTQDPKKEIKFYEDKVYNSRYPNPAYVTISRIYSTKRSKIGYPILLDRLEIENYKWLSIKYGMNDINDEPHYFIMNLPISFDFSNQRPYSVISVRLFAKDPMDIYGSIITYDACEDNGWKMYKYYIGNPIEVDLEDDTEVLVPSNSLQNLRAEDVVMYDYEIKIPAMSWKNAIVM